MSVRADDFRWDFGAPLAGDRAVAVQGDGLLVGRRVALLISGGIAAYRTPGLARELRRAGATVQACVTPTALQFVTLDALQWATAQPVVHALDGRAQHVEGACDAYLLAPATYSTLNKAAAGSADNAVTTTLAAALGLCEAHQAVVLVAPTMHGSMWNAILRDSLARLANLGVVVVRPRGGDGKARLPDDAELVAAVAAALARP
ncbi:MAG: hypothetical protein EXR79_05585 [Myxococcales bacterium]|nr:hypothetical protein [Myxococcales bacterium]